MGRLYDAAGNRMTPSHANKRGLRYRYYVSSALSQGRPAGAVTRVSATTVESLVVGALRERYPDTAMNGQLPRGVGVTRLIDAPIEWSRQWHMLGL